jgi:hypothetical protein
MTDGHCAIGDIHDQPRTPPTDCGADISPVSGHRRSGYRMTFTTSTRP